MGPIDTYIVYRFVRLLTTPWDETDAFRTGVLNSKGEVKADLESLSKEQKASYTLFDRMVFNIKRLIEKLPGGKSKIGTYAAALYLFKEEMGDREGQIVLERSFMSYLKDHDALEPNYLEEQNLFEELLPKGTYRLKHQMMDIHGNNIPSGTTLVTHSNLKATAKVLGVEVFQLKTSSGKVVVVSREDIQDA